MIEAKDWSGSWNPVDVDSTAAKTIEDIEKEADIAKSAGYRLEIRVSDAERANSLSERLEDAGISNVTVRYLPKQP